MHKNTLSEGVEGAAAAPTTAVELVCPADVTSLPSPLGPTIVSAFTATDLVVNSMVSRMAEGGDIASSHLRMSL